jgi:hypothetical protein
MEAHLGPMSRKAIIERMKRATAAGASVVWGDSVYYSTVSVPGTVADADPVSGTAMLVIEAQDLPGFFSYGKDGTVQLGPTAVPATEAETNLVKAKSTNGNAWFSLEALGLAVAGHRIQYPQPIWGAVPAPTNPAVVAALAGNVVITDPSSWLLPPECGDPSNLELPVAGQVLRSIQLHLERDGDTIERIGSGSLLPNAGGESYLRANGEPSSSNRYRLGAGYVWAPDGAAGGGSELAIRVRVTRPVVIPITLIGLRSTQNAVSVPSRIWTDVTLRAFGVEFKVQGV